SSITCSLVTPAMCSNPSWKAVLTENCPKTCGLCTATIGKLQENLRILQHCDHKVSWGRPMWITIKLRSMG
ncbi:hypothetical protein KIN20_019365, partial [Parelaphostrongylus tenuis]